MQIPITENRKKLEVMTNAGSIISDVVGVRLIETRNIGEDMLNRMCCCTYVYGLNNIPPFREIDDFVFARVPITARETSAPCAGDLAIYLRCLRGNALHVHIGRVVEDNFQIISKWGTGHIYLHKPELVPAAYGEEVRFFRETPTNRSQ